MITVILEESAGRELDRAALPKITAEIVTASSRYELLSSAVSDLDYEVYAQSDMPAIVGELERLRASVDRKEDRATVDRIIDLAKRCQRTAGATLTFTPF
jgi:hypothetical protein